MLRHGLLAWCAALAIGTATQAATILVTPGPGTPVQDAIDAASPGDSIRLAAGDYPEHITIAKALRLRGMPRPTDATQARIAGGCTSGAVLVVGADDVQVKNVFVIDNAEQGVDVTGRSRVKLTRVFVASNCSGGGPGPAVNVDQSTRVTIDRVDAAGYVSGAIGIRLAGLAADAGVRVRRSFAGNNYDVGMLVDGAGARSLRVSKSILSYATVAGLIVQNANGIVVDRNRVRDNGTYGILVQSGSDGNQFAGNEIIGNGTDVTDNGSGNCWRSNTFVSGAVPPCP